MLLSIIRFLHAWKRYGAAVQELSSLNDRELADQRRRQALELLAGLRAYHIRGDGSIRGCQYGDRDQRSRQWLELERNRPGGIARIECHHLLSLLVRRAWAAAGRRVAAERTQSRVGDRSGPIAACAGRRTFGPNSEP